MSIRSVLNGCHEVLTESAAQHRYKDNPHNAAICDIQADAVLKLLADLDKEQEEETSDERITLVVADRPE